MTLGRLAGHTTELFRLMVFTLTMSEFDMAVAWQPYTMVVKGEMLQRFEDNASEALAAFKQASDKAFHQSWTIKRGPNILFSAGRSTYFRNQGIDQIVHHRAQLGTYIRALGLPLPGVYGPSADGISSFPGASKGGAVLCAFVPRCIIFPTIRQALLTGGAARFRAALTTHARRWFISVRSLPSAPVTMRAS